MNEKIYRIGVIGCGRFGKNHIKTINNMSGVEVAAICTSNEENAKLVKNTKVQVFKEYSDMIVNAHSLDFVIIASPPSTHYNVMDCCISVLKPFIVEKPFCTNYLQTKDMVSQLLKSKVPCMVDFTQLFNPAFRGLVIANSKQKIKAISSKVHAFGPFRKDVSMFWDWLPHDLSMIQSIAQSMPEWVRATQEEDLNYDNAGQINVELKYKNFTAKIEIDNVAGKKYRVFEVDNSFSRLTMMDNELYEIRDGIRSITVGNESALQVLINSTILHIETGESYGLELSLEIAKIIEKTIESVKEGDKVSFR